MVEFINVTRAIHLGYQFKNDVVLNNATMWCERLQKQKWKYNQNGRKCSITCFPNNKELSIIWEKVCGKKVNTQTSIYIYFDIKHNAILYAFK